MHGESGQFGVKVGVHQGSVLSPLLFTMVLEALSRVFREGLPWELLYADDLALMADSEEKLLEKLKRWKQGLEDKGLRVNIGKTKVIKCQVRVGLKKDSRKCHVQFAVKVLDLTHLSVFNARNGSIKHVVV